MKKYETIDELLAEMTALKDGELPWYLMQGSFDRLPDDISRSVLWAAAIPHWYKRSIICHLVPEATSDSINLLNEQIFTESFQGKGRNIHELSRILLLEKMEPGLFLKLSSRAEEFFRPVYLSFDPTQAWDTPWLDLSEWAYHKSMSDVAPVNALIERCEPLKSYADCSLLYALTTKRDEALALLTKKGINT
jgi:hypothetical protein